MATAAIIAAEMPRKHSSSSTSVDEAPTFFTSPIPKDKINPKKSSKKRKIKTFVPCNNFESVPDDASPWNPEDIPAFGTLTLTISSPGGTANSRTLLDFCVHCGKPRVEHPHWMSSPVGKGGGSGGGGGVVGTAGTRAGTGTGTGGDRSGGESPLTSSTPIFMQPGGSSLASSSVPSSNSAESIPSSTNPSDPPSTPTSIPPSSSGGFSSQIHGKALLETTPEGDVTISKDIFGKNRVKRGYCGQPCVIL